MASGKIEQPYLPPLKIYNQSVLTWNTDIVDTSEAPMATIIKYGRMVLLNCQCRVKANVTAEQGTVIATLPSYLKPAQLARAMWVTQKGTYVRYGGISPSEDAIYMNSPIFTASQYLFFVGCVYLTNDLT